MARGFARHPDDALRADHLGHYRSRKNRASYAEVIQGHQGKSRPALTYLHDV